MWEGPQGLLLLWVKPSCVLCLYSSWRLQKSFWMPYAIHWKMPKPWQKPAVQGGVCSTQLKMLSKRSAFHLHSAVPHPGWGTRFSPDRGCGTDYKSFPKCGPGSAVRAYDTGTTPNTSSALTYLRCWAWKDEHTILQLSSSCSRILSHQNQQKQDEVTAVQTAVNLTNP